MVDRWVRIFLTHDQSFLEDTRSLGIVLLVQDALGLEVPLEAICTSPVMQGWLSTVRQKDSDPTLKVGKSRTLNAFQAGVPKVGLWMRFRQVYTCLKRIQSPTFGHSCTFL